MRPIASSTHNHYQLEAEGLAAELDVLSFKGEEWLSQPFKYTVAFTSQEQDIEAAQILGKDASFHLGKTELTTLLNAGGEADVSVVKRLFVGIGQGAESVCAQIGHQAHCQPRASEYSSAERCIVASSTAWT